MSKFERTGNPPPPEPPAAQEQLAMRARWIRRARRIRNEVGIHLLRGAATAIGSAIVAYSGFWIHSR